MKKNITCALLLHLITYSVFSQPGIYSLINISEAIKNKASIIIHLENIQLDVEDFEKATLKVHKIFTVLNEEGKHALIFKEFSSKMISLEEVEIKVFDLNGKLREKHKKRDMMTTATGEGLIEEGYVTYYPVTTTSYPITLDIAYEQKIRSTLFIPDYRFISMGEAIIQSTYTVRVPSKIGLRYKAFNTSIKPLITEDKNYKVYTWSVKDHAPIEYEEGAVSGRSRYPHIAMATDNFSYYGFQGDLSTWKGFGLWIKELYKDLDVLTLDRRQFFVQLVKDAPNEKEKIKRIYDYMQHNFRYVSIQLGIGGLKPFSAGFTDKKKYGDCKSLSNYMKSALQCVGIQSHVAIINANYNELPVDPFFPANGFNHVILCIPAERDSVWLECTSSTSEFGELGTFTENKNALLITDHGGVLVPTPKSNSHTNIFSTTTIVNMSDDLSAETETIFKTRGEYKEMMNDMLTQKKDHQKETLVSYLGFKQPDYFELLKDKLSPACISKLKMSLRNTTEFNAGNKFFISPRLYKMWPGHLPKSDNRKFDFYFRFPFEKNDTTIFRLPVNMKPDALPGGKDLNCNYAFYKTNYWYNEEENSIYSVASFTLKQYKILAGDYVTVKKFFDELIQDASQKIIVKKIGADVKAY